MALTARITARTALSSIDVGCMFRLFGDYYDEISRAVFEEDLSNKRDVILLQDETGAIQGFSTLSVLAFEHRGQVGRAVFSGDTIIAREHWGTQALPLALAVYSAKLKAERFEEPLYWLLISKGYRTYRYLPLLFHEYYPRHSADTPEAVQQLIDHLATGKFGGDYHPASGLVRFPHSRGQLKRDWANIPEPALRKPEVRFFLERNPGYRAGHELVCVAELSVANLRSIGRRTFESTLLAERG